MQELYNIIYILRHYDENRVETDEVRSFRVQTCNLVDHSSSRGLCEPHYDMESGVFIHVYGYEYTYVYPSLRTDEMHNN